MKKISGNEFWNKECYQMYGIYDSSKVAPKRFLQTIQTIVYMTDFEGVRGCDVIWGKDCDFYPGDTLLVKAIRWHSPGTGLATWKHFLIDKHRNFEYTLTE
jgi:hypothetical protein